MRPFLIERLYFLVRLQTQNWGCMLFEDLQSFLLSRYEKVNCIHEPSNQIPDLRFMAFHESHGCGQGHAPYHGHGAHTDDVASRSFCANIVGVTTDEGSSEISAQYAFPTFFCGAA